MVILTPLRKGEQKNEETKPIFGSSYLVNAWHDLFEIWNLEYDVGGHLHSKNRPVSYKQHKVTYTQKLHYCSSC